MTLLQNHYLSILRGFKRCQLPAVCALLMAAVSGCQTYVDKNEKFNTAWRTGDLQSAKQVIVERAEKAPARDKVVMRLEEGSTFRALMAFGESDRAFLAAEERIEIYDQSADISVSTEVGSTVVNQAVQPYRGLPHDKIMLSGYLALNRLAQDDVNGARVELNRSYDRQRQAVDENARRIEKATEAAQKNNFTYEQVLADQKSQIGLNQIKGSFDGLEVYNDYVNPFVTYLQMVFLLAQANDFSDLSQAQNLAGRLSEMVGDLPALQGDIQQLNQLLAQGSLNSTTYLFVETGMAPKLDQIRIDLPTYFIDKNIPYVGAALPYLVYENHYVNEFSIEAHGNSSDAGLLVDFDRIVRTEFKNRFPEIVIRTLISSAVKAVANSALQHEAGVFGALTGAIYQASVNIADTRTWTTLPKEILVARIPTPEDRKVSVVSAPLGLNQPIELIDGHVNVVYVKSVAPGAPVSIHQFRLK